MSSCPATDNVFILLCFVTGTVSQCLLVLFLIMFHSNYGPVPRLFHKVPPFFFLSHKLLRDAHLSCYRNSVTVSPCSIAELFRNVCLSCYRNYFKMSSCSVTDNVSPCLLVSHILLYNVPVLCKTVLLRKLCHSVSLSCYRLYNPYYTYVKTQISRAKDS